MARNTKKPILFISHISEEKETASLLKEFFENAFLDAIEVFVSSNEKSITYGAKWLDRITTALQSCNMMLILCSKKSVQRPWINYEAGFGNGRDVDVIPVCYAGQDKGQLPAPLSFYQGLNLFDSGVLESLMEQIADTVNMRCPSADCKALLEQVKQLEDRYLFWDICNTAFERLEECAPSIVQVLKEMSAEETYRVEIVGIENCQMIEQLSEDFFSDGSILAISNAQGGGLNTEMQFYKFYDIIPQKRFFEEILSNAEFKFM